MRLLGIARIIQSESLGNTRSSRGNAGERDVCILLNKFTIRNNYHAYVLRDLRIPYKDNEAQIDFVYIFKKGIFVIEVKNWIGLISGNKEDKKWSRTYRGRTYSFLNPLFQNYYHVKALEEVTKLNAPFNSLIIFASNNVSMLNIDNVVSITRMNKYLFEFKNDQELSDEEIDTIGDVLKKYQFQK